MSDKETMWVEVRSKVDEGVAGLRSVESQTLKIAGSLAAVTAAASATEAAALKMIINTSSEFEQYQIRLNRVLGSTKEGARLFNEMVEFAGRVPAEFNDIMASATQLAGVMRGGVDEVKQWMPLIADLSVVSGLGIKETTEQVVRMYSAGAASADLFRERGITSMLGFQTGVSYSAEQTRRMLMNAWESPTSKFRNAAMDMSAAWEGQTSMMSDQWTLFKKNIGDAGVFESSKGVLADLLLEIDNNREGVDELAKSISDNLITSMQWIVTGGALAAKGLSTLDVAADGMRIGIDAVALASVQSIDFILAGVQELYDVLDELPGGLGEPYAQAKKDVQGMRQELKLLEDGIKATGAGSMDRLNSDTESLKESWDAIDKKASKFFNTLERGRGSAGAANDDVGGKESPIRGSAANEDTGAGSAGGIDPWQTDLEKQRQYYDDSLMMQQEFGSLFQIGQTTNFATLMSNTSEYLTQSVDLWKQGEMGKLQATAGIMGMLSSLQNTKSRAMFEVGKAANMSSIIASTPAMAVNAYKSASAIPLIGHILGPAAGLAAIIYGGQQLAATASAKFGGGSISMSAPSVSMPSSASPSAPSVPQVPSQPPAPSYQEERSRPIINHYYNGTFVDTKQFVQDGVLPEIYEADANGEQLIVSPDGRTAQEIRDRAA